MSEEVNNKNPSPTCVEKKLEFRCILGSPVVPSQFLRLDV